MRLHESYAKGIELIGFHDLKGKPGFQMAMQEVEGRYYLYLGHFRDSGWTILDVTDPSKPRYVRFLEGPDKPAQVTIKLQVADGLMLTSLCGGMPKFDGKPAGGAYEEGMYVWDVKDPENPRLLSHWQTGVPDGRGIHRFFYNGGPYVHVSACCPGFANLIYRIVDISDPTRPVEAGRWWLPEQWAAGGAEVEDHWYALHGPPYPKGDLVYCSYGNAGMVILDISDIAVPKFVGQLHHHPPFAGRLAGARCHTVLPLSQRPLAVMTSEGERYPFIGKEMVGGRAQPLNFIGMVDVADPSDPTLVAVFPYPEVPEGYPYKNFNEIEGVVGPFGPHNLHEPHYHPALEDRNDRIYCAYFHAGLRIYDISDRFVPKEIAYFIPPAPEKWAFEEAYRLYQGPRVATTEDVLVDNRGNIFLDTFHDGLYILRCTV